MKAESLWYYSFKPILEYELLLKRISMRNHLNVTPKEVPSYIVLSSSDQLDHSAILCLLGRDSLHWQPNFWKELLRHGLYRIKVEPNYGTMTLKEFMEYELPDNHDYLHKWYKKIADTGNSIYITINEIPADEWVSVEHYNGESWSKVDFKKLGFTSPGGN